MNRKTDILHSLLFLIASPLPLILAAPLVRTATLAGMTEVGAVTSLLTFLLTMLFLSWDARGLRDIGLGLSNQTMPRVLLGIVVGFAIVGLQEGLLYASGHIHWIAEGSRGSIGLVLLAFMAYLLLALREELVFRGYPLRSLERAVGMWGAILVVAIVFSLEHAAGGWTWSRSLLGPPAGAILFGLAALTTRGIAVPLGIHAAFNFGQWVMGQKELAGLYRPVVEAGFEKQAEALGYAGYLLGTLLAARGFCLWQRGRVHVPLSRVD